MTQQLNHLGQPIGPPLPGWQARLRPPRTAMEGRFCQLEAIDPGRHAADLFAANADDRDGRNWTYLPYGPSARLEDYRRWMEQFCCGDDPLFHAILERQSGRAVGVASFMRIDPASGVIEVGGINYSPRLQRTPAATEAMYLMMRRVFDELGYRRYEWIFRQAIVYKGRSRDTAWFSIIDGEWPALKAAFERWLDPANFDESGC